MASLRRLPSLLASAVALGAACGGGQHPGGNVVSALASRCEVTHTLRGDDEVEGRIVRLEGGWSVSVRLRVRLAPTQPAMDVHGLGNVVQSGSHLECHVADAGADPGAPRFDRDLCLDEMETLGELLTDAQQAARPGETVVQEVRLRSTRRRHARSHVAAVASFQERAEVTRDAAGRVVRLVRATERGGREEIGVAYPDGVTGRCLPSTE